MRTIDEMLHLSLITPAQHQAVSQWISQSRTPEDILQMPPHFGRPWSAPATSWALIGICRDRRCWKRESLGVGQAIDDTWNVRSMHSMGLPHTFAWPAGCSRSA